MRKTLEANDSCTKSGEMSHSTTAGKARQERLGKKLAYLLRYGAEKEGLVVTTNGFVSLKDLETVSLLEDFTTSEIVNEVDTSVSMRKVKRFEQRVNSRGDIQIRATYGRRMERTMYHDGSRVRRLLDISLSKMADCVQNFDFTEFPDNYLMNLIMRKMKRKGTLTNKSLRTFLVPAVTHLDLWSVFVNEKTLNMVGQNCHSLQVLILRDCGYVVTDHLLNQILRGLPVLESLNLSGCHHVTDNGLRVMSKHCSMLKHVNLTFVKLVTVHGICHLLNKCTQLEEINIYDFDASDQKLEELLNVTECRQIRLEIPSTSTADIQNTTDIYDSIWERPNFR